MLRLTVRTVVAVNVRGLVLFYANTAVRGKRKGRKTEKERESEGRKESGGGD